MARRLLTIIIAAGMLSMARTADAQSLGTFRWQLQPFCNIVSLAVTQNGGVFGLEGTDNQCGGGADLASVVGTAFQNPDGTIGFGLNIVASPGGVPVTVDAGITIATLSGTWRDGAGNTGAFVLTPGAGTGGNPRPLPAPIVPAAIQLRTDGGFLAGGTVNVGTIPASGPGVRMMWHPAKAALRAGRVLGTEWDDGNVGLSSAALGQNTVASGQGSTAMGLGTIASGNASTAIGTGTIAVGTASLATGVNTSATGDSSTAMGVNASTFLHAGSFVYGDASTGNSGAVVANDAPNSSWYARPEATSCSRTPRTRQACRWRPMAPSGRRSPTRERSRMSESWPGTRCWRRSRRCRCANGATSRRGRLFATWGRRRRISMAHSDWGRTRCGSAPSTRTASRWRR